MTKPIAFWVDISLFQICSNSNTLRHVSVGSLKNFNFSMVHSWLGFLQIDAFNHSCVSVQLQGLELHNQLSCTLEKPKESDVEIINRTNLAENHQNYAINAVKEPK